jgi:Shedu protein SduA, C-terminal
MSNQTSFQLAPSGPAFLGLCDRANYVRQGNTNLFRWNVLGLGNVVLSFIFPLRLDGWFIGFAFRSDAAGIADRLRISDNLGNEVGTLNLSSRVASPEDPDVVLKSPGPLLGIPEYGWIVAFFPLTDTAWIVSKPGIYYLERFADDTWSKVGTLEFVLVDPPPLTPDRITAIKSEPNAAKSVRIEIGCKHCPSKFRAYAALEKVEKIEKEGWTWYGEVPSSFGCACGRTSIDLQYIKRNLFGLLGRPMQSAGNMDFVPLYRAASLRSIFNNFNKLISGHPSEELLQKFMEENPILLHQFPSNRILTKPKILLAYVADFGIVTPTKELLLIELEKSDIRLLKKDGGIAAPLNHAFDQVRDWLHDVDEHRLAVLDSLEIAREEVSAIRGVVIAGRDSGYDAKDLRKLKGMDRGRITFMTYDDLLFALDALTERVEKL